MEETIVSIPSAGLRLHGALGAPADLQSGEQRAAFLVLHGFGTNSDFEDVRQPTRVLNEFGYVTLRFDMRGCGKSEGEFGRIICLEQVEDLGNALDFLARHPAVDPDRIGVIGSSFGGAVAVYAAAPNPRIAAVVSNGGWGHGERKFRGQHRDAGSLGQIHRHARGRPRASRAHRQIADGAALRHRSDPGSTCATIWTSRKSRCSPPMRWKCFRPRRRKACSTFAPRTWSARSRRGRSF